MKKFFILLIAFLVFAAFTIGLEAILASLTTAILIAIVVRAVFQYTED